MYSSKEDSEVLLLSSGFVKRYKINNNGSLAIQIIYGPQDIFSLSNLQNYLFGRSFYDGPEEYFYQAMCDTVVYSVTRNIFKQSLDEQPLLYKELFYEAGNHLKICVNANENMTIGSTYKRVAHQLLFFANQFSEICDEGTRITLPLTHQDLADVLGTTRETVTIAMTRLRAKNFINDSRQIVIPNMERLSAEVYQAD